MVTIACACGQDFQVTIQSHEALISGGGRYACRD